METTLLSGYPHRRLNPLTGEWVLNSPHRNQRPWQGKRESNLKAVHASYDPECYLCPGNERAGGVRNPDYEGPYVFNNDFAALLPRSGEINDSTHPLLQVTAPKGTCRVVCFSPRHDLTLPQLPADEIVAVIDLWAEQISDLGETYRWVQIFENKGEIMGCSNPHPHGQIWATDQLPNEPFKEDRSQRTYMTEQGTNLLMDYQALESARRERVVVENDHWVAVVPFWAVWPYETMLLPKRHVLRIPDLNSEERIQLADILKRLLTRYDNLFEVSFPYSMGWHGAPNGKEDYSHWQLHAHFYPPLLRSATVKKFMVGYEMLSESQRDLVPEQAASQLRELPEIHFTEKGESQS